MELLADSPSGMLLSELAGESGLHISTVHRLLNSLIERGYARKDLSSNRYCLTLRLFEVVLLFFPYYAINRSIHYMKINFII